MKQQSAAKSVESAGSKPARSLQKGAKKREAVIRVAARLFSEKGYNGTTLQDIAEAAGTQPGSLYYHFASREDIVREVLRTSMTTINERVVGAWAALPPDAGSIERIRAGIAAHMHAIHSGDPYLSAYDRIINEVSPEMREEFVHLPRLYGNMWRDLIGEGQARGEIRDDLDPSLIRLFLLGSVTWSHLWFDPGGRRDIEDVIDHFTAIFLGGIGAVSLGEERHVGHKNL